MIYACDALLEGYAFVDYESGTGFIQDNGLAERSFWAAAGRAMAPKKKKTAPKEVGPYSI